METVGVSDSSLLASDAVVSADSLAEVSLGEVVPLVSVLDSAASDDGVEMVVDAFTPQSALALAAGLTHPLPADLHERHQHRDGPRPHEPAHEL